MTKLIRIFTLSFVLLLTQQVSKAAIFLEGFYRSNNPSITIELRETREGITVKRSDSNNWFSYEQVSRNLYRDRKGNSYYVYDDDEIEFRDRYGRSKIRFYYDNRSSRGVESYDDWDRRRYDNPSYNRNRSDRYEAPYRFLRGDISGVWESGNRGRKTLQVRQTGSQRVEVRRSGKWITFYYQGNGVFEDRNKNRIYFISNNTLRFREWFGGNTRNYYRQDRYQYDRRDRGNRGNQGNRGNRGNRGGYCPPGY